MKRLPLVTCFVVVGACGDDDGGAPLPLEELPAELTNVYCQISVACHDFPDEATCQSSVHVFDSIGSLQAAVERGTVIYDPEAARACVNALAGASHCTYGNAFDEEPQACDLAVQGTVAEGGTCYLDEECLGDANCEQGDGCTTACCMGTCVAGPADVAEGQPCALDTGPSCENGTYCKTMIGATAGVCTPSVTSGGPCETFDACAVGYCDLETMMCPELAAQGETCDPTSELSCERYDDYCDPTTMKCQPLKAPGQPCAPDAFECVPYADCVEGTCTAIPGEGQPCTDPCLGDLVCTGGACVAPEPEPVCPAA